MNEADRRRYGFAPRPTRQQQDDTMLLYMLMNRQTSGIADCLRHMFYRGEWDGYIDHLKTELADLSIMVRRMASVLSLDYDEIVQLGVDRDAEKRTAWLERHPKGRWV